jgi:hypothetical protein
MAGFLQTAFQSNTADNTSAQVSIVNSSSTPLGIAGIFTGTFENCSSYGLIQVNVSTDQNCTLFVQQSYLGTAENIVAASQFSIVGSDNPFFTGNTKFIYITYPFFRVELVNTSGIAQTSLYLSSKMTSTPPASAGGSAQVPLNPVDDGVAVYGSNNGTSPIILKTDVAGVLDVNVVSGGGGSGNVVATNLITQTLATRTVQLGGAGVWYRVASVGNDPNSTAIWASVGALVGTETVPVIGRLFKLTGPVVAPSVGPYTQGTIYDVEYSGDPPTLSAATSGVLVSGSTDPSSAANNRVIKTDTDGVVSVNIVGGGAPTVVAIQGSEDLTFAQTATTGRMIVEGSTAGALALDATTTSTNSKLDELIALGTVASVTTNVGGSTIIVDTPITTGFDMWEGTPAAPFYSKFCVMGQLSSVPEFTSTTPLKYLCLQYSNDNTNWFGDGQYPSLLYTGTTGVYTFIFLASGIATRYVRVWGMLGGTLDNLIVNRLTR